MRKKGLLLVLGLLMPLFGFADEQGYAVFDSETGTLTFKYGVKPVGDNVYDTDYTRFTCDDPPTWDCSKIKKVVFDSSFTNARPTSTHFWFNEAQSLTEIVDLQYLNTSEVTDMEGMFGDCESLTSLDLSHFETGNVECMKYMFSGCSSLKSLDLRCFDTAKVWLMDFMFAGCGDLESLDVSSFNTSNVVHMENMFTGCESLTSLDVSNFNTSNVKYMFYMFAGCGSLTNLDLSGFDTKKITTMRNMFWGCSKLRRLDVSHFDTSNVTDMSGMFSYCQTMGSLDLSSFDTSLVTDMTYMFDECRQLETIYVGENWTTANVTSGDDVFYNCNRLFGGMGTAVYECEQTDYTYARIDGSPDAPGYLTDIADRFVGDQGYAVFDSETGILTFKYGEMPDEENVFHTDNTHYKEYYNPAYWDCSKIQKVVFDPSFANARPKSTASWFYEANLLSEVVGIEYLNTSNVTDMNHMFMYCRSLTSLDLSHFDASNVTDMSFMFGFCTSLKKINLSHFDTSHVVNMKYVFYVCSDLTRLDLGSFDTSNVTNMEGMFCSCRNLETIYVGDLWSISNVTEGEYVFSSCEKLVGGMGTAHQDAYENYTYARIDGGDDAPGLLTEIITVSVKIGANGKTTFCGDSGLDFSYSDEVKAFIATGFNKAEGIIWMTRVKDVPAGVPVMIKGEAEKTYKVPVTDGGTSYYKNMFVGNTSGESITINETTEDGMYENYYLSSGTFKSVNGSANIGNNKCYLQLPANFAPALTGEGVKVKIANSGKSSFAAPYDLDFTDLGDDLKAFTATGYDKSTRTIWLTRVKKVQKGEGLFLKGDASVTYTIPSAGAQAAYENMIVGNTSGETLEIGETAENGMLTNYYLKGGTYMKVVGSANIGNNKSYLQLPTEMLAGVRGKEVPDIQSEYRFAELETESMPLILGSTTGIDSVDNGEWIMDHEAGVWYDVQGRKYDGKPTKKGVYIRDGKKVVVK